MNYVTAATYAPFGGLASMTNGAIPITTSNSYNKRLQPVTLSASTTSATVLSLSYDFHLAAGDNGDVYQIVNNRDNNRTQNFTYDELNRIQTAATQGTTGLYCWGQRFGHMSGSTFVPGIDPWGNLKEITATQCNPLTLSQTVLPNNRFSGMTYDAAGKLTNDGGGHSYTYDAENRLTATAGYTYVYDGDGNRVKKTNGSTGTLYWRGTGSDPIAESSLTGTNQKEFIFFNGKRVARRDVTGSVVHYYFSDHLGSASVVTNAAGTMVPEEESDYYPYGGERAISDTLSDQNYKFTGKERDSESGLDEFGARYYASSLGRFMIPDWAGKPTAVPYANYGNPQSLNLYSYVQNNPTTVGDPDGHDPGSGILLDQLENKAYMEGQQKGAEIGLGLFAGVGAVAASWEAGAATLIRNLLGLGLANAPQAQRAAEAVADMVAPPGTPSFSVAGAAEAFGFKSFGTAGSLVGGELKNGASAAVNFSKAGSELGVGISFVKGPSGTLKQLESGAINAGKASGAESVKMTATMVKDSMARLLSSQGFTQEMKNGKATGNWIKTIKLKKD